MTTAQELQKRFHACMPLFIALGDEMRLSIIEVLTEEALDRRQTPGPIHFEQYGLNVNEITRRTSLSRPAISHHLKILKDAGIVGLAQGIATLPVLLSHPEGIQPPADGAGIQTGRIPVLTVSIKI